MFASINHLIRGPSMGLFFLDAGERAAVTILLSKRSFGAEQAP